MIKKEYICTAIEHWDGHSIVCLAMISLDATVDAVRVRAEMEVLPNDYDKCSVFCSN